MKNNITSDPNLFFFKQENVTPNSMVYNNKIISGSTNIVNSFADCFQKSFIPSRPLGTIFSYHCTPTSTKCFSEQETYKVLQKIKNKMASGPNGLSY